MQNVGTMSTTLGIDLASQHSNTAFCIIDWHETGARVEALQRGGDDVRDEPLRAAIRGGHTKVGIDAPFGWPAAFVAALTAHERFEPWPDGDHVYRLTDRVVHAEAKKLPLSVSTDKIAYCAMRCARLLDGLADAPRDGCGLAVETYPDAALRRWLPEPFEQRPAPSYKGVPGSARRKQLVDILLSRLGKRFSIGDERRAACVESDDCLDAVLCALVARAAERGKTIGPTEEQRSRARTEGWIHLPEPGSLTDLIG
jgi:predicted nuclease with RNAse H fold